MGGDGEQSPQEFIDPRETKNYVLGGTRNAVYEESENSLKEKRDYRESENSPILYLPSTVTNYDSLDQEVIKEMLKTEIGPGSSELLQARILKIAEENPEIVLELEGLDKIIDVKAIKEILQEDIILGVKELLQARILKIAEKDPEIILELENLDKVGLSELVVQETNEHGGNEKVIDYLALNRYLFSYEEFDEWGKNHKNSMQSLSHKDKMYEKFYKSLINLAQAIATPLRNINSRIVSFDFILKGDITENRTMDGKYLEQENLLPYKLKNKLEEEYKKFVESIINEDSGNKELIEKEIEKIIQGSLKITKENAYLFERLRQFLAPKQYYTILAYQKEAKEVNDVNSVKEKDEQERLAEKISDEGWRDSDRNNVIDVIYQYSTELKKLKSTLANQRDADFIYKQLVESLEIVGLKLDRSNLELVTKNFTAQEVLKLTEILKSALDGIEDAGIIDQLGNLNKRLKDLIPTNLYEAA